MVIDLEWLQAPYHRFDYYRATVSGSQNTVLDQMITSLEPCFGMLEAVDFGPERFYRNSIRVMDTLGNVRFRLLFSDDQTCNVVSSGSASDIVARVVREFRHRPSRCDVRVDATGPDLWRRVERFTADFAKREGILRNVIANDGELRGDTIYLGSRTSQTFVRIYQKGLKEAVDFGLEPHQITDAMRGAVRFELEFKPQSPQAKQFAATARPAAFWGACSWSKRLASAMLRFECQRYVCQERKSSDTERALAHMGRQYAKHLETLLDRCDGDICQFGEEILKLARLIDGVE